MVQQSPIDFLAIANRIIAGGDITRDEAKQLFLVQGGELYDLFYAANKVRRHFHSNKVTFAAFFPPNLETVAKIVNSVPKVLITMLMLTLIP